MAHSAVVQTRKLLPCGSRFAIAGRPDEVKHCSLREFLGKNAEVMTKEVEAKYRHFAGELGEPGSFDKRINYYKLTFDSIANELNQSVATGQI